MWKEREYSVPTYVAKMSGIQDLLILLELCLRIL